MKILVVGCVCLYVFEFVNPLSVMIQGCLISILLKKMCFLKKVKIQHVEMSIQSVVLHSVYFEKDLEKLDFVVKPIQSVDSCFQSVDLCFQSIDFLKTLTKFY